jgi:hypothetical protein
MTVKIETVSVCGVVITTSSHATRNDRALFPLKASPIDVSIDRGDDALAL